MSDFAESSVIPSANDDFHATNNYQGLALCDTFDEDGYHAAESLMHVTRVAGPLDEQADLNDKEEMRKSVNPLLTPPEISVPPRASPPSFEHIHPPPSLSFERLAFRMDLEDLKRTMRMQKQESFRPYPQPHTSREILSTGTNLERHSHYWTYQRNQISAPYSTAKASKKARRLSKRSQRGIGGDSSSGSDHPGERSISLPAVYD